MKYTRLMKARRHRAETGHTMLGRGKPQLPNQTGRTARKGHTMKSTDNNTFALGTQRFSYRIDRRTGTPCIQSIHPYDETEYHWARREPLKSDTREWRVYRNGKRVCSIWLTGIALREKEIVAEALLNLDNGAHLTRLGGIW